MISIGKFWDKENPSDLQQIHSVSKATNLSTPKYQNNPSFVHTPIMTGFVYTPAELSHTQHFGCLPDAKQKPTTYFWAHMMATQNKKKTRNTNRKLSRAHNRNENWENVWNKLEETTTNNNQFQINTTTTKMTYVETTNNNKIKKNKETCLIYKEFYRYSIIRTIK